MRLGLREANQQFARAIRAVRAGEDVVLTERGKPVAVIKPFTRPSTGEAAVRRMEAAGLLTPATRPAPMPPWRPRPLRGVPVSRTIREERDAR
jgi:prevent-host-death family protein